MILTDIQFVNPNSPSVRTFWMDVKRNKFYKKRNPESDLCLSSHVHINVAFNDVPDIIKLFDNSMVMYEYMAYDCLAVYGSDIQLIVSDGSSHPTMETCNRDLSFTIYGNPKKVKDLYQFLMGKGLQKNEFATWYYATADGNFQNTTLKLKERRVVYDEIYPFIEGGVDQFYDDYMNSESPVLICLGEPGTGKTSFIRNMIYQKSMETMFTYDARVMEMDSFFVNYITEDYNLLVMEDSDILLTSRERSDNRTMNKLLNSSDGLVSIKDKKIIFTANMTNTNEIDDALMRPGRCYKVISFRPLTKKEAFKLAEKANIEIKFNKDEYTLAEIFNGASIEKQKVGFL